MRHLPVSLSGVSIAIHDTTISEARELDVERDLKECFVVVAGTLVQEYLKLVQVGLTDIVVQVTLPQNVFRGGPLPLAGFALASVTADKVCGM